MRRLLKFMWSFLSKLLGGSNASKQSVAPAASQLPPLPVGSVAAVADALTQAGRIAEQQTALRNTVAMQQAAQATKQQLRTDQITTDIANENTDATARDLAD